MVFALVASVAAAQPPAKSKSKGDPQSTVEPRSKPGAGQKFLLQFVGDWSVHKKFTGRTGAVSESNGTCKQRMIQDGRFLESDFTFEGPTGKTTGLGLIGFEADSNRFTSVWIDSRSTRMSFRQS